MKIRSKLAKVELSVETLNLFIALFTTSFLNLTFFRKVVETYPLADGNYFFVFAVYIVLTGFTYILLSLVSHKRTYRPILILFIFTAAIISYFSDNYGTIANDTMILSIISTDMDEARDLMSFKFLLNLVIFAGIPTLLILLLKIKDSSIKESVIRKLKFISISFVLIFASLLSNGKSFASFFRAHKSIRFYTNPTYLVYSTVKLIKKEQQGAKLKFQKIGQDARIRQDDKDRELIIFVIGETARRDHFSLNGYEKKTNPLLEKEDVVSFSKMSSCATSTAESLPCMFSLFNKSNYNRKKAINTSNALDILHGTNKVNILWRDNNSNSKGVANRIGIQNYKGPKLNTICNPECRDEGMLVGLQDYINQNKSGDIFIILHQMGSHGPAYYKRYPKEFRKFTPTCETQQLEQCSAEEISNTYDNTILYTDYFLSKVIQLLKNNSEGFETAMIYASDHGESLGENGVYLHGIPEYFAPEPQKSPASIVWLSEKMKRDIDYNYLKGLKNNEVSHDNLFHSILAIFEVETKVLNEDLSFFKRKTLAKSELSQ